MSNLYSVPAIASVAMLRNISVKIKKYFQFKEAILAHIILKQNGTKQKFFSFS